MAGRPSSLKPAVAKQILEALKEGVPREMALLAAGVGRSTFYSWLAKARQDKPVQLYVDFLDAVEKAEAEAVVLYTKTIHAARDVNWQAAAWWLERRHPDLYGRRDRISIEALKRSEVEATARELGLDPDEVLAQVDALLARSS